MDYESLQYCHTHIYLEGNLFLQVAGGVRKSWGHDRVAVQRLHPNEKDVGSNLTATRNVIWTLGDPQPPQKVVYWSRQDLIGRPAMSQLK